MQHNTNVKLGKLWISVGVVTADWCRHFVAWEWAVNSPHTPSLWLRIPEEHGGSSGSGLAAPLQCLQAVLHPVLHSQGAPPGSVPHPNPMWAPAPTANSGGVGAEMSSFLTRACSTPVHVRASANFKCWHLVWVPSGLTTYTSVTSEAVTRAIQMLVEDP